jgi:hypothetical protein
VEGAPPLLLARRIESADAVTVLMYGHGDVVNGQEGRWQQDRSPWQLSSDGDRWYGRGTADNKGQHSINLGALAAAIEAAGGKLGCNLKMIFEMGEEVGRPVSTRLAAITPITWRPTCSWPRMVRAWRRPARRCFSARAGRCSSSWCSIPATARTMPATGVACCAILPRCWPMQRPRWWMVAA